MHRAIPLGLRALQFLCAVTILGLAAAMIKNQVIGSAPVTTRYSTFTGGFGIIVCAVGALGLAFSFIPAMVPMVLDGLAGLLFLAGGIAWAVGLRTVDNCTNNREMLLNPLLNQGSVQTDGGPAYGVIDPGDDEGAVASKLRGNCQRARADEVLQFICFAFALGLVAMGFMNMRRVRGGAGAYVA